MGFQDVITCIMVVIFAMILFGLGLKIIEKTEDDSDDFDSFD